MSPVCQRPGASSARRDRVVTTRVCETTGQPASDKILPPFLHTHPPKPSYLYVIGVCVREARPPYCNRSLRVWLTHTHRGMLLARRHTGAGSVASKQRGERESGSVCVRVVRRFHPPIVTAPATPATGTAARSKARFSFVWPGTRSRCLVSSWTVFDSLLMGGTKLFHLRSLVLLSEPEMEAAVRSRTPSRPLTLSARAWCKSRTCTQTLTLNLTLC